MTRAQAVPHVFKHINLVLDTARGSAQSHSCYRGIRTPCGDADPWEVPDSSVHSQLDQEK